MTIRRLRIAQFRNIAASEIEPSRITIFCGCNGSGKTSILEAAFLLGTGRSFRSARLEPVIADGHPECWVHGILEGPGGAQNSIGIGRRRDGALLARINGQNIRSAMELARRLPVQLINAGTFGLLEGGPRLRRQFLDWGVFHVEPDFHRAWADVHRVTRQRNSLLRHDRIPTAQIELWDAQLAECANCLDRQRARYFEAFLPVFRETLERLTDLQGLELGYYRGWDRNRDLRDVLQEQLAKDHERGFTHSGPHRADVRMRIRGSAAQELLSRGQQKLVVSAMKLAQVKLFRRTNTQDCVFLIDDLPAELDREHRKLLFGELAELELQLLITCVEVGELEGCWGGSLQDQVKLFHVEQGVVSPALMEPSAWKE